MQDTSTTHKARTNKPYVRQEIIAPPTLRESDYTASAWRSLKKEYKDKLQLSVATTYPKFFDYKQATSFALYTSILNLKSVCFVPCARQDLKSSSALTNPTHKQMSTRQTKGKFRNIDAKSDLYVYFYLHGLSLLNPKGSFCFITSNSWLNVGYGKDLQELSS